MGTLPLTVQAPPAPMPKMAAAHEGNVLPGESPICEQPVRTAQDPPLTTRVRVGQVCLTRQVRCCDLRKGAAYCRGHLAAPRCQGAACSCCDLGAAAKRSSGPFACLHALSCSAHEACSIPHHLCVSWHFHLCLAFMSLLGTKWASQCSLRDGVGTFAHSLILCATNHLQELASRYCPGQLSRAPARHPPQWQLWGHAAQRLPCGGRAPAAPAYGRRGRANAAAGRAA